ncbi:MAG: ComEA family DNA-binding protein [Nevskiales bacterium]|nr:ComEA family DNA-binding protein [Nevskiales bacterium]
MKGTMRLVVAMYLAGISSAFAGPVNINTADAETLQRELKGVGEARAAAIIQDRQANGPFESPEDIVRVDGIGEVLFEQNKDNIKIKD